jgi:hypothetical protein
MAARRTLSIEAAARKDLAALPAEYRNSALAKSYLLQARRLDAGVSGRDVAMLSREMRLTLLSLYELAPAKHASDPVDELKARREQRMSELPKAAKGSAPA